MTEQSAESAIIETRLAAAKQLKNGDPLTRAFWYERRGDIAQGALVCTIGCFGAIMFFRRLGATAAQLQNVAIISAAVFGGAITSMRVARGE